MQVPPPELIARKDTLITCVVPSRTGPVHLHCNAGIMLFRLKAFGLPCQSHTAPKATCQALWISSGKASTGACVIAFLKCSITVCCLYIQALFRISSILRGAVRPSQLMTHFPECLASPWNLFDRVLPLCSVPFLTIEIAAEVHLQPLSINTRAQKGTLWLNTFAIGFIGYRRWFCTACPPMLRLIQCSV